MLFIASILGSTLFRHFDFNTLTFKKPGLDALYAVVFLASLFFLFKGVASNRWRNKTNE